MENKDCSLLEGGTKICYQGIEGGKPSTIGPSPTLRRREGGGFTIGEEKEDLAVPWLLRKYFIISKGRMFLRHGRIGERKKKISVRLGKVKSLAEL